MNTAVFALIAILLISGAIGGVAMRALWPRLHWLNATLAAFLLGSGAWGWTAFVLAEFGWLNWWSLLLAAAGWLLVVTFSPLSRWLSQESAADQSPIEPTAVSVWQGWAQRYGRFEPLLLLGWLVVAGWLFLRPHQFLLGAADAGVYVNLAHHIADTGQIMVPESGLTADTGPIFLRDLGERSAAPFYLMPSFYAFVLDSQLLSPQFYHLHPVWQAIAALLAPTAAAQVPAILLMSGLWSLLSSLLIYATMRTLVDWPTALLALAGLTVNGLQIWFARYPTTEPMTQFLLWGGIWATVNWLGKRPFPRLWALLAGLTFGLLFLARIDAVLLLPVLGLFGLWRLVDHPRQSETWLFLGPLGLLIGHAMLHGYWQSRHYFLELFGLGIRLLNQNVWLMVLGGLLGVVVWAVLVRARSRLALLIRYERPLRWLSSTAVFAYLAYNYLLRPVIGDSGRWNDPFSAGAVPIVNHENLLRLGWYITPIGVWLGIVGVCWLIYRIDRRTLLLVSLTLLFTIVYLINIRANPHQVYTMRRLIPAAIPLFTVGTAVFLSQAPQRFPKQPVRWGTAVLLAVLWLGGLAYGARGLISQIDYVNLPPQLDALNAQLAPNSVLLFNDQAPIGQGDLLGTPLKFLYGHDVYTIRQTPDELITQLAPMLTTWQAAGRTVYWLQPDGGQTAQLPPMRELGAYEISTMRLEYQYEKRPSALQTLIWRGTIFEVLPLEAATPAAQTPTDQSVGYMATRMLKHPQNTSPFLSASLYLRDKHCHQQTKNWAKPAVILRLHSSAISQANHLPRSAPLDFNQRQVYTCC